MGYLKIDPRGVPEKERPLLAEWMSELVRELDGTLNIVATENDRSPGLRTVYYVQAETHSDEEVAGRWDELRARKRAAVRWGAGQRRRRR
jgi:hypothetical protein